MSRIDRIYAAILLVVIFSVLYRFSYVELFNEDYLILHWQNPASLGDCFKDFFQRTTGGPYWRPLTWSSYFATKYYFGLDPFPYHLTNIALFSFVISSAFIIYRKIGINRNYAFAGLALFALSPARELNYAWIPARTDLFAAFFLLISTIFYLINQKKFELKILSTISFLFAILSKEIAFAGAAIPLLVYYIKKDERLTRRFVLLSTLTASLLVAGVLLYRYFFIGGNPFESQNYDQVNIQIMILNFFIYLPLILLNADLIQQILAIDRIYIAIIICLILVIAVYFSKNIVQFRKENKQNYKIIIFGFLWHIIFILPALPRLMQWYGFIAYFGLLASILAAIDDGKFEKIKFSFIVVLLIILIANNYTRAGQWQKVSRLSNLAIKDLSQKVSQNIDTLYIIAAPDKINRINAMKIGLQEAINAFTNRQMEIISPFRCEVFFHTNFDIEANKQKGTIIINPGVFILQGSRSKLIFSYDKFEYEDDWAKYFVENNSENGSTLKFYFKKNDANAYIYDGKYFIKIE